MERIGDCYLSFDQNACFKSEFVFLKQIRVFAGMAIKLRVSAMARNFILPALLIFKRMILNILRPCNLKLNFMSLYSRSRLLYKNKKINLTTKYSF